MRWNSWRVLAWYSVFFEEGGFFFFIYFFFLMPCHFLTRMPKMTLQVPDSTASRHHSFPHTGAVVWTPAPPCPTNLSQNGSRPSWQRMLIADNGLFDLMANKTPTDVLDWGGPGAGERKHVLMGLYEVICGSANVTMNENMSGNRGNLIPLGTGNSQHYQRFAAWFHEI